MKWCDLHDGADREGALHGESGERQSNERDMGG